MDVVTLGIARADARKRYGQRPNTIALMGDSLAQNHEQVGGTVPSSFRYFDATAGFLHWALAFLSGRMRLVANTGVTGNRTDQWIASGQVDAIIAAKPAWVVITPPTNDRRQDITFAAAKANYTAIINRLQAAGIKVVVIGLLPEQAGSVGQALSSARLAFTVEWSMWLRSLALTTPDLIVVDPWRALTDGSTTGSWIALNAQWTTDGLHPSNWAVARIGRMIADALEPHVPYLDPRPLSSVDRRDIIVGPQNLLLGSGMHGSAGNNGSARGGTGTVVSNFNATSDDGQNYAGAVASSIVPATDQCGVPWQQHALTTAASRFRIGNTGISSGFNIGDTIRPMVEIDMDADLTNIAKIAVAAQCVVPGGIVESSWFYFPTAGGMPIENRLTKDARGRFPVLVGPGLQIPVGTTSIGWYLDFRGMGTFRWRFPALRVGNAF